MDDAWAEFAACPVWIAREDGRDDETVLVRNVDLPDAFDVAAEGFGCDRDDVTLWALPSVREAAAGGNAWAIDLLKAVDMEER